MSGSLPGTFSVIAQDCHLEVDPQAHAVRVNGVEVPLTPTEYDVLVCLAARMSAVVPLDDLIEAVWGDWFGPRGHVSVHVHHLRRKLGSCGGMIVNRRGVGYMLSSGSNGARQPLPPGWGQTSFFDVLQVDGGARSVIWLLINADRTIGWVSDSVTTVTGWTPQELVGQIPWAFAVYSDPSVREAIDAGAWGRRDTPSPVELRCADGSSIWVNATSQIYRDADGGYLGGLTECRQVESPASSSTVVLIFDADSILIGVEPHAPFLGWDPEDVMDSYFSLAGLEPSASHAALAALVATGVTEHEIPVAALGPDGRVTPTVATLRLDVANGRLVGYTGEFRPT